VQHFSICFFQSWKFMTSLILYAVDYSQSNIDCDVASRPQILTRLTLLSCVNRTLNLMPHVYEVLCAKQTRKIRCNNIYALHRYRNFCVLEHFILTHPVCIQTVRVHMLCCTFCDLKSSNTLLDVYLEELFLSNILTNTNSNFFFSLLSVNVRCCIIFATVQTVAVVYLRFWSRCIRRRRLSSLLSPALQVLL